MQKHTSRTRSQPLPASGTGTLKVFRDPVHDLIALDAEDRFILELIDCKEFQRLRRIRQLGLGSLVYPGAEHTRFAHSLGVFNFARRILERLRSRHGIAIRRELDRNSRTIKAAALLHDLGHGPYSHVFERVFRPPTGAGKSHEDWTCEIICSDNTEVSRVLRRENIDPVDVARLISGSGPKSFAGAECVVEPYLQDIVSSQLDADRMDYLLRDSLMTGSPAGAFDSEWILNALTIGEIKTGQRLLKKLCLDASKGTGAIEGFLISRLQMTRNVYGHKTTRAYEGELLSTLRLASECADWLPDDSPQPVTLVLAKKGRVDVKSYLMLDDEILNWALRRWAVWEDGPTSGTKRMLAAVLSRHALRLVRRHRPWATVELTPEQYLEALNCVKTLDEEENPLRFECLLDDNRILPYKDLGNMMRDGSDAEQSYFKDIYLKKRDGSIARIGEFPQSTLLAALKQEDRKYRMHFDREFQTQFARLLRKFGISLYVE